MTVRHFTSAASLRRWLAAHCGKASELWVGFYKKGTGRGGLTYPEAVAEALCFGWIDGLKKRVDELRYTHRFTPRRTRSVWSRANIRLARGLIEEGRMQPAGLRAFEARDPARSGRYSFENVPPQLPPSAEKSFRREASAWAFFQGQPTGYQQTALWWVLSARREETRARRLARLIADSRQGRRLAVVTGKQQPIRTDPTTPNQSANPTATP